MSCVTRRCLLRRHTDHRTTYQQFGPAWSTRTVEEDPGAPFFDETPTYVVSGTLTDPDWPPGTVLGPYDPHSTARWRSERDNASSPGATGRPPCPSPGPRRSTPVSCI
jgi:hypothetical protein